MRAWMQRFALLLLMGGVAGVMVVGSSQTVVVERLRTAVVDGVAPLLDAASRPAATAAEILQQGRELAALRAENEALRAENDRLLQWQAVARQLEAENQNLRELTALAPEPRYEFTSARVIGDRSGAFVRSVLVNAGAQQGLAKGQAALTGAGLAGRIVEVGQRSARVLLVTDLNSRIPVVVEDTRQRAVMAGDNSDRPRLVYLPEDSELAVGQRLVTSGHGGVFPPGLPVGVVSEVGENTVRVRPIVDLDRMEYLRLVDYALPGLLREMDQPQISQRTDF